LAEMGKWTGADISITYKQAPWNGQIKV
jgi:hypothetical protein